MKATWSPLSRSFYEPSAAQVAPALLGHFLLHRAETGLSGGLIVEVEAYLVDDPASHGFARETRRNQAMFGPPGHAYVYFIYGNYFCFNTVCGPAGVAEAVLVRAIQPLFGLSSMRERRRVSDLLRLTNGPGKLCAALAIGREHDRLDLCDARSPVVIAANPVVAARRSVLGPVVTSRRIGLTKAAHLPLRFYLEGSQFVSRRGRLE